jgi:hypothetical protein
MVDIVHRIVWRGRRVSGHAHCKELLTLDHHMDTLAPDINLYAMRAAIMENFVLAQSYQEG